MIVTNPDGSDNSRNLHYEILGVLAHLSGRLMGFPTLFGNSSPQTGGTGDFCIMGTSQWNNNGKTPSLPSAWIRYYAGWETPLVINATTEDIQITHPMSQNPDVSRLIKIEFSEREYLLIENRQHDFTKDVVLNITTGEWRPTINHTFELLPDDEQDFVYSVLLDGTGVIRVPMVNLMKNNLRGSEWDFFIPYVPSFNPRGYQDPSGLFIWHIDEYVIETNMENNTVNADPSHFGVGLKEAAGINYLSSAMPHPYMRGGPFMSFRKGNNDYLGFNINPTTGFFAFPTAESHYGGIQFEIHDLGQSENSMTFSVRFEPRSETEFFYENFLEPFAFDFSGNGVNEVHYFHSDGFMSVFENHRLLNTYWLEADTLAFNFTFDGKGKLVIPAQDKFDNVKAKLISWDGNELKEVFGLDDWYWAGSPVYIDDEWEISERFGRWVLAL
jgi:hypothetical protein